MKKIYILIYTISSLALSSCATFFGAKSHDVLLDTKPGDANAYIDGKFVGKTPVVVSIPLEYSKHYKKFKKKELEDGIISIEEYRNFEENIHRIVYSKEEYETIEFFIKPLGMFNKKSPNYKKCVADAIMGTIFLEIPLLLDMSMHRCSGFEKQYTKTMSKIGDRKKTSLSGGGLLGSGFSSF